MTFTSVIFFLFIIISLSLYYIVNKNIRWSVLLISSCTFYLISNSTAFFYVLLVSVIIYFISIQLNCINENLKNTLNNKSNEWLKENKKRLTQKAKKNKKKYMITALVVTIGILFVVKYLSTIYNSVINIFDFKYDSLTILMPLGISYYTFQSIGYLIDVFYGRVQVEKNYFKLLLFLSFFPQVVQGPISKAKQLMPQLLNGNEFNYKNFCFGCQLILYGMIKKLIISNILIMPIKVMMNNKLNYDGAVVALMVILGYIQIYADFSGGIDIARGISGCFGITMAKNFHAPFFASSLTDYWRRWHISLGSFMKDYVMMPLNISKPMVKLGELSRRKFGFNIGKLIPVFVATFVVFFLVGIWHGPEIKYIYFGVFNGIVTSLETVWQNHYKKMSILKTKKVYKHIFSAVYAGVVVFIANLIYFSNNFSELRTMIKNILFNFNIKSITFDLFASFDTEISSLFIAIITLMLVIFVDFTIEKNIDIRECIAKKNIIIRYTIWICLFIFMLIYSLHGTTTGGFAYEGF